MSKIQKYNPDWIAAHYDKYADREWDRFTRCPADAVSLFIHTYYLKRFVKPGSRVLDIGAGPGRFTQILAEMGCHIVAADISPVQLELHRRKAEELGFDDSVEDRMLLDVCDMSCFKAESFDTVICYGGPLSYVFDLAQSALRECARICRKNGHVLVSVMSLWGAAHRNLKGVLNVPPENNRNITDTGDLTPENWDAATHHCHMFRSEELRKMAPQAGLTVEVLSASNCISTLWDDLLNKAMKDQQKWRELLRMELEACSEKGCLDMGTHIIIVGRKN